MSSIRAMSNADRSVSALNKGSGGGGAGEGGTGAEGGRGRGDEPSSSAAPPSEPDPPAWVPGRDRRLGFIGSRLITESAWPASNRWPVMHFSSRHSR
jgi:hypothetical protein